VGLALTVTGQPFFLIPKNQIIHILPGLNHRLAILLFCLGNVAHFLSSLSGKQALIDEYMQHLGFHSRNFEQCRTLFSSNHIEHFLCFLA